MTSINIEAVGVYPINKWYNDDEEMWVYEVGPDYLALRYNVDISTPYPHAIVQLNTASLPDGAIIDSAVFNFKYENLGSGSTTWGFYLGDWAATPPAGDEATFTGGASAGSKAIPRTPSIGVLSATLTNLSINLTGNTSLRIIDVGSLGGGLYLDDHIPSLDIEYHVEAPPPRRKWLVKAAP